MFQRIWYFLWWITPTFILKGICFFFGHCLYFLITPKRNTLLRNLYLVFPHKTESWRRKIARRNCCRWVETALLCLFSWALPKSYIRKRFRLNPQLQEWLDSVQEKPEPYVVLVPHLNLMEAVTWLPALSDKVPTTGVVYRPFRHAFFENWIRETRERFGLQLISRKRGISPLEKFLSQKNCVSLLFDQSAGDTGTLTTFFGKLASTTDLPGRLVEKFQCSTVIIYPKRTGFVCGELCLEHLECKKDALSVTLAANRWLEEKLSNDANFYGNWLWMHRRWKTQTNPLRRFNISQKRNAIPETLAYYQYEQLPQKTHMWVRFPNWLGDCVMFYPCIKALRNARPDFYIHALVQEAFAPLVQQHFPVDVIHTLPKNKKSLGYWKPFLNIRKQYPDVWLSVMCSPRQSIEAWLAGAEQRFMLQEHRSPSCLLWTHHYKRVYPTQGHQFDMFYQMFKYFGLKEEISYEPFENRPERVLKDKLTLACFCGSGQANAPKRWPVHHWQNFLQQFLKRNPKAHCILLGGKSDIQACNEIAATLASPRVENLAGTTTLLQLEEILSTVHCVIGNDCGGIHLANALGIPVIDLFGGNARPEWTSPIFDAPKRILQAPVYSMNSLNPEVVLDATQDCLKTLSA